MTASCSRSPSPSERRSSTCSARSCSRHRCRVLPPLGHPPERGQCRTRGRHRRDVRLHRRYGNLVTTYGQAYRTNYIVFLVALVAVFGWLVSSGADGGVTARRTLQAVMTLLDQPAGLRSFALVGAPVRVPGGAVADPRLGGDPQRVPRLQPVARRLGGLVGDQLRRADPWRWGPASASSGSASAWPWWSVSGWG